jgi:hypothetical protein
VKFRQMILGDLCSQPWRRSAGHGLAGRRDPSIRSLDIGAAITGTAPTGTPTGSAGIAIVGRTGIGSAALAGCFTGMSGRVAGARYSGRADIGTEAIEIASTASA